MSPPIGGDNCLFTQFLYVFHVLGFALEHIGKSLRADGYRTMHKLWYVIALHELTMVVRIGTRQLERLGAFPFLVNMSDKRTGIVAIDPATAE